MSPVSSSCLLSLVNEKPKGEASGTGVVPSVSVPPPSAHRMNALLAPLEAGRSKCDMFAYNHRTHASDSVDGYLSEELEVVSVEQVSVCPA